MGFGSYDESEQEQDNEKEVTGEDKTQEIKQKNGGKEGAENGELDTVESDWKHMSQHL
jgi:hypothetical protein